MSLIGLLVSLLIILVLFWAVRALLAAFGVGDPIATVVQVIFGVIIVLWLAGQFGVLPFGTLRIR